MKIMIASDIHGSALYCRKMISAYRKEQAERLVLLGDLLYHGPRNPLPEEYSPQDVIAQLNTIKQELLCVRGNCEAEVDQMVLEFPVMAEYALFSLGRHIIFATHGHHYNPDALPPLKEGDILLTGHTHIPACRRTDSIFYMNPGSVSIPKESSVRGYMIWENADFMWKDLDGTLQHKWTYLHIL